MWRRIGVLSVLVGVLCFGSVGFAAPPVLEVSPTYLEFSAYEGSANPENQIVSIWRGGGNGPLNWEVIEDCNWLTVNPTSGKSMGEVDDVNVIVDISGLSAGTYNCELTVDAGTAVNSPQIVDVNLIVIGPILELSATQFEFTAIWGGPNPSDQILSISNSGSGTLNWEITEDCGWLTAEPNSGSSTGEADDVNLSVDITGLAWGTYGCQLTVSDVNAANSPQIVDVNLIVIGPIIELSATRFKFSFPDEGGNPPDQILNISNSSVSTLNWTIDYDCGWLDVYPTSGSSTGDVNEVVLSVDINGLDPNDYYTCDLTVSDPNAENNPQIITVVLSNIITVKADGTGDYPTIQAAITAATTGDTIILLPGTYTGTGNKNLDYDGKAITVRSTDPYDPVVAVATVIDCQNAGRGFYFHSGEDANSIVAGLTVKNGRIVGTYGNPEAYGGGIYCSGASPTIVNSHILNNSARRFDEIYTTEHAYGGGISCISNSHPTIINCEVRNNLATAPYIIEGWGNAYGGGIYCSSDSSITIYDSIIANNAAHGGWWGSDASWIHYPCGSYGGGVYISGSTGSSITNCVVSNNQTAVRVGEDYEGVYYGPSQGAGIYSNGNVTIKNCSICNNDTDPTDTGVLGEGGGIYGAATVKDSIIWANLAISQISGSANITYSDVESGWAGTGNIDADPCFADPCNGDYHLKSQAGRWDPNSQTWVIHTNTSPCIDAGNPGCPLGDEPNDPNNIRINMGAYGGTAEASKSPANWALLPDLTNDHQVDFFDLRAFVNYWLNSGECIPSDLNRDESIDLTDFAIFADNWLTISIPTKATNPNPADKAIDVNPNIVLSWSPGLTAFTHDVYFGTDYNDVNDANTTDPNVYMGNQDAKSWDPNNYDPNSLAFKTTYYWRIDEKNSFATTKGDVWSFTTWGEPNSYLVSWWKFDEGSGTTAYDSAGDNDGTVYGASWTTGQIDGALSFDGVDDYVDCGNDEIFNFGADIDFSISTWVKTTNTDLRIRVVNKRRQAAPPYIGFDFNVSQTKAEIRVGDGSENVTCTGITDITDGSWHFITAVAHRDGSLEIYTDGNREDFKPVSTVGNINNDIPLAIGRTMDYDEQYFDGTIDDVRIYDRALSAEEILQLYLGGL